MSVRYLLLLVLAAVLALGTTACGNNDEPDDAPDDGVADGQPDDGAPRPRPAELDVAESMGLADLPDGPGPGQGIAVVDGQEYPFTIDFCADDRPVGTGEAEGLRVAWDLREDGDHRVSVRFDEADRRLVRGGPAEAEWGEGGIRFAGAFLPFRSTDPDEAVPGGIVATCEPPAEPAA